MHQPRRGKRLAVLAGSIVIVLATVLVLKWERMLDVFYALRTGYDFVWMPDGVVPGGGRSLNNSGQVAVEIQTGEPEAWIGVWSVSGGSAHRLGTIPEIGSEAGASAINGRGGVVGNGRQLFPMGLGSVQDRAFVWTPEHGISEVSPLRSTFMYAADINNKTEVVGTASGPEHERAFLWDSSSGTREIGALTETGSSYAVGINSMGWIAGNAEVADGSVHPVLWKPQAKIADLGCPPGYSRSTAVAINERNEILVDADKPESFNGSRASMVSAPFLWSEQGGYVALPSPPGYDVVTPFSLSNNGHVLLRAKSSSGKTPAAFIAADGKLTQLPLARGGLATFYLGLNDKDWVAGYIEMAEGSGTDGKARRGFVAMPYRLGSP